MHLHFLVLLLCLLYGSVFTVGKITLDYASPLFITSGRMLLAAILLLAFQYFFKRKDFILKKANLIPICVVGITNVYLTNFLEFWGLQFMESGKACFLYSFAPIVSALLSYVCFNEKITSVKWIGLIIGLLGFLPLLIIDPAVVDSSPSLGFLSLAEVAVILAAASSAVGWIFMRILVKKQGLSLVMANGTTMWVGGIFALIHSFFVDTWNPLPVSDITSFLPSFLALTLISNILCYNLNAFLLRHYTATYISLAGLMQPIFAAILGYFFLAEVMSYYFWISIVAVSTGLYLYYQQDMKQGLIVRNKNLITENQ